MCITEINGISLYQSTLFSQFNITHGFTARKGGVSSGAYESLSMSPRRGDNPICVRKNEQILCNALNLDLSKLTATRQEHTANIEIIDEPHIGCGVQTPWEKGVDGIITTLKDVPILCYSADCVPILIYCDDIKAVAAVHSGWKGTAQKILSKAINILCDMGSKPQNIFISVGPCIGKCCYEVSEDVATLFDKDCYTDKENGKYMLDLAYANCKIAYDAGVLKKNISVSKICTRCNNEMFFSHRGQGGKSGTLAGVICLH